MQTMVVSADNFMSDLDKEVLHWSLFAQQLTHYLSPTTCEYKVPKASRKGPSSLPLSLEACLIISKSLQDAASEVDEVSPKRRKVTDVKSPKVAKALLKSLSRRVD